MKPPADFDAKRRLNDALVTFFRRSGSAKVSAFPSALSIDVNNNCNLRCPFCVNKFRRESGEVAGMMSFKRFKRLIDLLGPYLESINFGDKSEPTLNRDIYKMIGYASNKYNISCQLTTNFNRLSKEDARALINSGLAFINAGAEGVTQATYGKYRVGGNLARVSGNIRLVQKLKKAAGSERPDITIQYIVFKHNERDIPKAKKAAAKLGVKLTLIPGAIFDIGGNYKDWLPENPKYSRYTIKNASGNGRKALKISHKILKAHCTQPWSFMAIDANGSVYTCCGEHDADYSAGNIFKDRFGAIWNGRMFRDARSYLAGKKTSGKGAVPCRKCCDLPREHEIYYPEGAE